MQEIVKCAIWNDLDMWAYVHICMWVQKELVKWSKILKYGKSNYLRGKLFKF